MPPRPGSPRAPWRSDRVHKFLANAGLVKARVHNNPQKAQPKKKAQERAAAAAKAAETAEAPAA